MTQPSLVAPRAADPRFPWRWTAVAFFYWLGVTGALEPGNIAAVLHAGAPISWGHEAMKVVGAGLLGASATPLLLGLARRFPVRGDSRLRNALLQAGGVVVLAPGLIVASCFLAAWFLQRRAGPALADIRIELAANLLLIAFCLSLFLAVIEVAARLASANHHGPDSGAWARQLTLKDRGRLIVVDLAQVEWIETQGNYQALHTSGATHLLRETSARLGPRLDPSRFVRIHRRTIVASACVRRVEPLPNGDALVEMTSGVELRLSRPHRDALRAALGLGAPA